MDAITLLTNDHEAVEDLFARYETTRSRAHAEKRHLVDRMRRRLSVHTLVEEQIFYPVVRLTVPAFQHPAFKSVEEHHIVRWELSELDGLDPSDERFDARVAVMIANVRQHVDEEEQEFFPGVRNALGRGALNDLGDTMFHAQRQVLVHRTRWPAALTRLTRWRTATWTKATPRGASPSGR